MVLNAEVFAGGVAAVGVAWGFWKWLDYKLGKKADKHTVGNQVNDLKLEQATQRGHIGKLFDKLEEHSRRDEELAREVLSTMANNHAEVLRELGKKADR